MLTNSFNLRSYLLVTFLTSIWINASEVFRYFVLVMPRMKDYWQESEHAIADMNTGIFVIWGLWDTLLTATLVFLVWLYIQVFGHSNRSVTRSSTIVWAAVFVIFWVATANMGLSNWDVLLIMLPLSWLEMLIGGWIAARLFEIRE